MRKGGQVMAPVVWLVRKTYETVRRIDPSMEETQPDAQAFERQSFTFLNHVGYHFWPLLCLCGIAWYTGADADVIFRVALFAGSTIAVEICFGCVTHLSEQIAMFGNLLGSDLFAATSTDRQFLRGKQKNVLVARDRYWYMSCFTGVLWAITASVEAKHLAGDHVDWTYAAVAYLCEIVNVTLALKKLWYRVGHDSESTLELLSHFVNPPQTEEFGGADI